MCAYNEDSIAEMNIHESLVNLISMAEDALKIFNEIVDNLLSRDIDLVRLYNRILEPKEKIEESRVMFMEYLIRLSETLSYRQNYASIALDIEKFVQHLDGIAYRLALLRREGIEIDDKLYGYIDALRKTIREQFASIVEGLKIMKTEPRKTLQYVENISKLEGQADEMYREATYNIYTRYSNNTLLLMMMKDILDFMEDTSDLLKSIGEELRYLALHKVIAG
jgi:uncharacterized protein Yka (UPF0111/DUF47 family)